MKEFDYIEQYIKSKNFKRESSSRSYRLALNLFKDYITNQGITIEFDDDIFNMILDNFGTYITTQYTKQSIITFKKIIVNYFSYLEINNLIEGYKATTKIVGNHNITMESIISKEDFEKLEKTLKDSDDDMNLFLVYIAFYTGIKLKYLSTIRFNDFEVVDDKLYFINKIFRLNPFNILLPDKVKDVYYKLLSNKDNNYIFTNSRGNVYSSKQTTRVFEKICSEAGINHYSPREFRHSCIYYYIKENGADFIDLSTRFNWSNNNYDRMYKTLVEKN